MISSAGAFKKTCEALHIEKMSEKIENKILKAADEGQLSTRFNCEDYSKEAINIMETILEVGGFSVVKDEYFSPRDNKSKPILIIGWDIKEF